MRRKVAVPNVMVDGLKMPDAFAGFGVQREQAIGEKIRANTVHAIKIHCGRAGRNIDNSTLQIDSHSGPIICGTAGFPGVPRPGVVAELARMGDSVKGPAKFSGADIECANVPWRRRKGLRVAPTDDDQILVHNTGRGEVDELRGSGLSS